MMKIEFFMKLEDLRLVRPILATTIIGMTMTMMMTMLLLMTIIRLVV